jgi:hypothetical protein
MEIEAVSGENRGWFGEFWGVRVSGLGRAGLGLGLLTERVLWWFDAEATFSPASLCGGVFWSGEGEEADGDEGRWRVVVVGSS